VVHAALVATLEPEVKPLNDVSLPARLVWLLAVLAVYIGAFLSGATRWIIGTQNQDSLVMAKLSETRLDLKFEDSYTVMAFIYAHTTELQRTIIEILVGVIFITYFMSSIRTNRILSLATFFILSPILFFLMLFTKETMLVPFIISAAMVLRKSWPTAMRVFLVLAIYTIYAFIFRKYYLMIGGSFLAIVAMRRASILIIIAVCLAAVAVLIVMPSHVFESLQAARDIANIDRIGRDLPGMRTAFSNLVPPDSALNFVMNYAYAAAKLNFPILSGFNIRDVYMSVNMLMVMWVLAVGFRARRTDAWESSALFLSHVLVYICFEPDVGSYLRHVSVAMPYLVPALIVLDRRRSARNVTRGAYDLALP